MGRISRSVSSSFGVETKFSQCSRLGAALEALGAESEATDCYERALALAPNHWEARFNLANRRAAMGKNAEAIELYRQVLDYHPNMVEAHLNLGNALLTLRKTDEAATAFRRCLTLDPKCAQAYYNLGNVYYNQGRIAEAVSTYHQAVLNRQDGRRIGLILNCVRGKTPAEDSTLPEELALRWNLALARLLAGQWAEAWPDFELRMVGGRAYPHMLPTERRWDGRSRPHQRLLIHDEIGYGDVFNFMRYLPMVKTRLEANGGGGVVLLEVKPGLKRLMQGYPGVDAVFERSPHSFSPELYDAWLSIESLPGLFETTPESTPPATPIPHIDSALVEDWKTRLDRFPRESGVRRIGLVWGGNPLSPYEAERSLKLTDLAPLLALPKVMFVSLQKGTTAAQIAGSPFKGRIVDIGATLTDFADTAAVLMNLDAVIAVETSVSHLAGILHRPTLIPLAFVPSWRWLMGRDDSPWYPTVRLFRQSRLYEWRDVVDAMCAALADAPSHQE
ncbi:hypothetical protein CCP2SC5_1460006 [Azospirillaceae bacterium]